MIVKIRRGIYLTHLGKRQASSSRIRSPTAWQCSQLATAQGPSLGMHPSEDPEHVGSCWDSYLKLQQQQQQQQKDSQLYPKEKCREV